MGLLDDAIREHLELKRRHGGDPTEIARQEREAFGGRDTEFAEPPPPLEAGGNVALDEPAQFAVEPATHLHLATAEPPETAEHHEHAGPFGEDHLELEDEPPRPHGDPADHLPHAPEPPAAPSAPEPPAAPPAPPAAAPEPPAEPAAGQPTREFDLDEMRAAHGEPDVVPADEEPESEDVLEETPEFLQETPEHDRLWFEQRPPRDFDF